jgi:hypothetical protein
MYLRTYGSSPQITKKTGSENRKSAQCQMICGRSANLTNYYVNPRICGFAICGPPTFDVVHKLHIIYTLVNHGVSIYKVKRDINNNISNLKCK